MYKLLCAFGIDIIKLPDDVSKERKNKKISILRRQENLDMDTLESVDEFLSNFNISKK